MATLMVSLKEKREREKRVRMVSLNERTNERKIRNPQLTWLLVP